jgi:hypothetical protein
MVIGARLTGSCQEVQRGRVSRSTVARVNQEWSTTQRTSNPLDTIVGSIEVNNGPSSLWNACELSLFGGQKGAVQLILRKVFLMFRTLHVSWAKVFFLMQMCNGVMLHIEMCNNTV